MLSVHRHQQDLNQQTYAALLGVSQPYLSQLESGQRPLNAKLQAKLSSAFGHKPATLPLVLSDTGLDEGTLAATLAALGYPGFVHLEKGSKLNPAVVVLECLRHAQLGTRLVEALPWLLLHFETLPQTWLVNEAKLRNLQNHLGYLTALALELEAKPHLATMLAQLEPARLAAEQTLCSNGMPKLERDWLRDSRAPLAAHWNLLTDLQSDRVRRWLTPHAAH
ncbi:helix-turn-helix domain-containing protein [Bryobacter aggregatus]|uniref:helix-turn-helix domain-containing protein n=1 Tax=Bryobacter aggregatus TaxID=360054 RepID=UPI00055FE8A0|nr:helix-turn-helix transcriptional regulator [Bryobacter aggregatus]